MKQPEIDYRLTEKLPFEEWKMRNIERKKVRDLFDSYTHISNFVNECSELKDDVSFQNKLLELYSAISLHADNIEDEYSERIWKK